MKSTHSISGHCTHAFNAIKLQGFSPTDILCIGCGDGTEMKDVGDVFTSATNIVGSEINTTALAAAQTFAATDAKYTVVNAAVLDMPGNAYDFIVCSFVLCAGPRGDAPMDKTLWQSAIQQIWSNLKSGGWMLVVGASYSTQSYWFMDGRTKLKISSYDGHVDTYSESTNQQISDNTGLYAYQKS